MNNVVNIDNYKFREKMLSAHEMKKIFLGISQATLGNWVKNGYLNKYKIGGLVFYKESEVIKLIEESRESE